MARLIAQQSRALVPPAGAYRRTMLQRLEDSTAAWLHCRNREDFRRMILAVCSCLT